MRRSEIEDLKRVLNRIFEMSSKEAQIILKIPGIPSFGTQMRKQLCITLENFFQPTTKRDEESIMRFVK